MIQLIVIDSEGGESHPSLITLDIDRTCSEYSKTSILVPKDMPLENLALCKSVMLPVKIMNSNSITTLSPLQELMVCDY